MFAVNGAIVAALGPSVEALARHRARRPRRSATACCGTGWQNWRARRSSAGTRSASRSRDGADSYTERLDGTLTRAGGGCGRTPILAAMMVLSAACSGALAFAALGALGPSPPSCSRGLSYGVSDTGASMLTLWRWAPTCDMQRVDIAMLNAGFHRRVGVAGARRALAAARRPPPHLPAPRPRRLRRGGAAADAAAPPPQDAADAKELGDGDGDGDEVAVAAGAAGGRAVAREARDRLAVRGGVRRDGVRARAGDVARAVRGGEGGGSARSGWR